MVFGARKAYSGKLTLNVVLACLVAPCGGLILGYDLGIMGGVTSMTPFLKEFFPKHSETQCSSNIYCKYNSLSLTMITLSSYLAVLVASLFASNITRSSGQKISMLVGGVTFCVGALASAFAQNVWMLLIGRLLFGIGIGFANQFMPLYLSEVAPCKNRGALNKMFHLSITLGIVLANLSNYIFAKIDGGWGWRLSLGMPLVPAIIFIFGSFSLVDTPTSLIERGKLKEAKERLLTICGIDNVDEKYNSLVVATEESKKIEHPWLVLLNRKYRPQLFFAILIPLFQQFTGMNVFMFYVPVLFKTIGFGDNASLCATLITGTVNMLATFVFIVYVDKFGRRSFFLYGAVHMFIFQVLIMIAIVLKFGVDGNPGRDEFWYAFMLVYFICAYKIGFAWSWGTLGWLVPSEIFPLEIRSTTQSINISVNMICTFVIGQIFLQCALRFGMFIFFMIMVFIMTVVIYYLLPETNGIPIEEMAGVWKKHKYWKKFVQEEGVEVANVKKIN